MAVYFQNIDKIRSSEESKNSPSDVRAQLKVLKAELEGEKDAKKRFDLQRKVKRLERLEYIMEGKGVDDKNKRDTIEVLKGKNSDNIKNSDILTLRKKGVDIANLTLIDDTNPDNEIISASIKVGDTFTVNFGENKSLRDRTGAGDILPPSIKEISINGVLCIRKNTPRPGYYDERGKYQPIYDGYKIEIKKNGESTKEDEEANERQWKRERLKDMEDNDGNTLSSVQEDATLKDEYTKRQEERRIKRERYAKYNPENRDKFLSTFGDIVKRETDRYGIPPDILVNNLFAKENSSFNPNLKNPYSSALGFGQIINSTWRFIESSILFEDLDRYDPEDQIKATCAYLNYIRELKNCSWGDAVVYYHTGPGFGDSNVKTAMDVNPAIVAHMPNTSNPTARDYIEGAKRYYGIINQA